MRKVLVVLVALMVIFSAASFAAPKTWVVGFSQIGSESEWRTADTISVQNCQRRFDFAGFSRRDFAGLPS